MVAGPVLAGFLADGYRSYRPAFLVLAIIAMVAAFMFAIAKSPKGAS